MIYIIEETDSKHWVWSIHQGEDLPGEPLAKGLRVGTGEKQFATYEDCKAEVNKINRGMQGVYLMAPLALF